MQKPKSLSKMIEMAVLAAVSCVGCVADPTETPTASVGVSVGGYTGLGKYTGVSGTYGDGTRSSSGGASPTGQGGNGRGGSPIAGGTSTATGGVGSATGGSTGAWASTAGGSVTTGGVPTGGGLGGRVGGGGTIGGSSARGGNGAAGIASGATTAGGAATGGTGFAWPNAYNPAGTASDPTGKHNPGTNCMGSACHASTQTSRAFAFGGTVYLTGATNPAANVEVAITSGAATVTTYTAANGNFWLPLANAPAINWTNATVHLRNSKGEVAKQSGTSVTAGCNSCHGSTMRIIGP